MFILKATVAVVNHFDCKDERTSNHPTWICFGAKKTQMLISLALVNASPTLVMLQLKVKLLNDSHSCRSVCFGVLAM